MSSARLTPGSTGKARMARAVELTRGATSSSGSHMYRPLRSVSTARARRSRARASISGSLPSTNRRILQTASSASASGSRSRRSIAMAGV
eukprot:scaffold93818_cov62-Phaeocystis_antarctica.AAC.3